MDEQPNENRPNIPTWVWILTIFAVILGLQLWLSGRFSGPEQITLQEIADFIREDKVEQLVVSGDRIQVTLDDGRSFGAVKSTSDSLIETFQYYGITAEDLNDNLVVQDNSMWNTLLSLASVSYTHLDVYKRQTRARVWDVAVSTEPTMPNTPMIRPRTSWMGAPAVTMPCNTRK